MTYIVGPRPILAAPTAVAFEQVLGGTVAAPQVISLTGPTDGGAWTSEVDFLGASPWLTVIPSSGTSLPADVQLQVTSPAATPERHVAATLRFTRAGVTAEVSVRMDEHPPAITTSTPELLFTAVDGQVTPPPPQDVVLGTATGAVSGFTLASTSAWWLSYPASGTAPTTVPVSVAPGWFAPGRYDGELIVHPDWATDAADDIAIAVHYDVLPAALALSTNIVNVSVTGDTTEAQLATPVAITAARPSLAWTAQSSDPWIVADPPAGTGSGTLTISVPKAAIPSLGQGGFMGVVTVGYVEPGYGAVTREIAVYLGIDLPWIASLQPRIGPAEAGEPVSIWLAGTASSPVILFGGTPALAVGPHPDSGLLVTPPPLPAGRWPVTVQNGLGLDWRPAAIDLVAPTTRVRAAVASAGRKTGMAFDDATGMLWVANAGVGRVERYAEASGWTRVERAFAGLKDATLSPDGLKVVAVTERGLELVDAGVLDGPATVLPGFSPQEAALAWRLRISSDGSGLVVPVDPGACQAFQPCGIYFLRLPDGQFVRHPFEDSSDGWSPAVPDDLSRVWILKHGAATPAPARYMLPWAGTISLMDSPMISTAPPSTSTASASAPSCWTSIPRSPPPWGGSPTPPPGSSPGRCPPPPRPRSSRRTGPGPSPSTASRGRSGSSTWPRRSSRARSASPRRGHRAASRRRPTRGPRRCWPSRWTSERSSSPGTTRWWSVPCPDRRPPVTPRGSRGPPRSRARIGGVR